MTAPEVGRLDLQITLAEQHASFEVYTQLIKLYCNMGRLSISSCYLTQGKTLTLHAAGFYLSAQYIAQSHARKTIAKKINKFKKKSLNI